MGEELGIPTIVHQSLSEIVITGNSTRRPWSCINIRHSSASKARGSQSVVGIGVVYANRPERYIILMLSI